MPAIDPLSAQARLRQRARLRLPFSQPQGLEPLSHSSLHNRHQDVVHHAVDERRMLRQFETPMAPIQHEKPANNQGVSQPIETCSHSDVRRGPHHASPLLAAHSHVHVPSPYSMQSSSDPPAMGFGASRDNADFFDAGQVSYEGRPEHGEHDAASSEAELHDSTRRCSVDDRNLELSDDHVLDLPLDFGPPRRPPMVNWPWLLRMALLLIPSLALLCPYRRQITSTPATITILPINTYLTNITDVYPLIPYRLLYCPDRIPGAQPNSLQPLHPPASRYRALLAISDRVEDIGWAVDDIFQARIAYLNNEDHPYDKDAQVCRNHSQQSVERIWSLAVVYQLEAQYFYDIVAKQAALYLSDDLHRTLSDIETELRAIRLDPDDTFFFDLDQMPQQEISSTPPPLTPATNRVLDIYHRHLGRIASRQFGCDALRLCGSPPPPEFFPGFIHPLCRLEEMDRSSYESHDALVSELQRFLEEWTLDAEARVITRPPGNVFMKREVHHWPDGLHWYLILARYVVGHSALASSMLGVARDVQACQAQWDAAEKATFWGRFLGFLLRRHRTPDYTRYPQHPAGLPRFVAELEELLAGSIRLQITGALDAAVSAVNACHSIDQAQRLLESLRNPEGWIGDAARVKLPHPQVQAESIRAAADALGGDINEGGLQATLRVLREEASEPGLNGAVIEMVEEQLASLPSGADAPRPPTVVHSLDLEGTDWEMLLNKLTWNKGKAMGLKNRKRIWKDSEEILDRVDRHRREGRIRKGETVDITETSRRC
ncbi:hypothetical protein ACJ41O_001714 [Fusarium nematophilum]